MNELGIARGDCDRLHEVPAERLAAAIAPASRAVGRPALPLLDRYDFGPIVDGTDLPAQPFDPAAPDIARDIPLLIGGTREESGFFLADDDEVWERRVSEASLRRRIGAVAGPEADRVLDLYRTLRPGASREDLLIAALTGSNFWVRTVMLAERKAAQGRTDRAAPGLDVFARLALACLRWAAAGASRDGPAVRLRQHRCAGHDQGRARRARAGRGRIGDLGGLRPHRQPGKPGPAALARLHAGGARDDGVRPRLPRRRRPRPRRPPVVGADRDARASINQSASARLRRKPGPTVQQLGCG